MAGVDESEVDVQVVGEVAWIWVLSEHRPPEQHLSREVTEDIFTVDDQRPDSVQPGTTSNTAPAAEQIL